MIQEAYRKDRPEVLCAGVPYPVRNIYCIGRNYAKHAAELQNPVPGPSEEPIIFLKTTASLRAPGQSGKIAFKNEDFHHEVEIVILIGQRPETKPFVRGISVGLDLTRRGKQNELKAKGLPWTLAKSFEGSALVGNFLELETKNVQGTSVLRNLIEAGLGLKLSVNGERRQDGVAKDMIFSPDFILNYLEGFSPLQDGDLIFTGTPEGVGQIRLGDRFRMELTNLPSELGKDLQVFEGIL